MAAIAGGERGAKELPVGRVAPPLSAAGGRRGQASWPLQGLPKTHSFHKPAALDASNQKTL